MEGEGLSGLVVGGAIDWQVLLIRMQLVGLAISGLAYHWVYWMTSLSMSVPPLPPTHTHMHTTPLAFTLHMHALTHIITI